MVPIIEKFDIPKGISVRIKKRVVIFSNAKTKLSVRITEPFKLSFFDKSVLALAYSVSSLDLSKKEMRKVSSMLGSLKAEINQAICGISSGFSKEIELVGVGYKAELKNKDILLLKLGYSHDIFIDIPKELMVICPKETLLIIKSVSKESLGAFVSLLKKCKTPDVYKNKGVIVKGESLISKKFKKK